MNKQIITITEFYTQYALINENQRVIALVKVAKDNNSAYEVDMLEKAPSYLINVFDYIRANWR